jgi:hypothetical protein
MPGIHVLTVWQQKKDVDGRDKPGHDGEVVIAESGVLPAYLTHLF